MTHPCTKTNPAFQEDQEDLLMSYINSDYMTPSTSSSSPTTPTFDLIQGLNYATTTGLDINDSTNDGLFFRQQQVIAPCFHPDVLNSNLQFVIPSHDDQMQQLIAVAHMGNTLQNNHYLHQPPTPPKSFSSYSSSSDSEQPKKKRGRKKHDSSYSVPSCGSFIHHHRHTSTMPSVIALAPAPVKQLPVILPCTIISNSQNQGSILNHESVVTKKESPRDTQSTQITHQAANSTTNASATTDVSRFVNPKTNLKKEATTTAKRQERLINNRAAALLSRKRKREHVSALEEQCRELTSVNQSLLGKVSQLEKEKNKLDGKHNASTETFSSDIISMMILCYVVFIKSFSLYTEGLGGLSSSPLTSASFQIRSNHEECASDEQKKQTFAFTSLDSASSAERTAKCAKRGRFQRVPL